MAENTFFYVRHGVEAAAKKNNNVQLHEFGHGHCFPMDQPKDTVELILQILKTLNRLADTHLADTHFASS
jgi:hypothetical protein